MKLVIVSDMHIHPYRICSKDGGHDRLKDGLSVLKQSLELARLEDAVWVMAGDFKQPKTYWPQEALTGAHALLREYSKVRKVMLAGNHDAEGIGGSGLAPFRDCAEVVEKVQYVHPNGGSLLCAPWNADRREVAEIAAKNGGNSVLIAHGFLRGCALGPEDVRTSKGIPLEEYGPFSVAFFGDIHKGQWLHNRPNRPRAWEAYADLERVSDYDPVMIRQHVTGPVWSGEVFYCGSSYQQNWGERNDGSKGALVVNLKSGEVWLHPLGAPRFMHFEVDEKTIEGLFEAEAYDRNDFVRVVYTGKPCQALDDLREVGKSVRSFQLITRRAAVKSDRRADVHAGLPRPELLKRYMQAKPLPEGADPEQTLKAGLRLACD